MFLLAAERSCTSQIKPAWSKFDDLILTALQVGVGFLTDMPVQFHMKFKGPGIVLVALADFSVQRPACTRLCCTCFSNQRKPKDPVRSIRENEGLKSPPNRRQIVLWRPISLANTGSR